MRGAREAMIDVWRGDFSVNNPAHRQAARLSVNSAATSSAHHEKHHRFSRSPRRSGHQTESELRNGIATKNAKSTRRRNGGETGSATNLPPEILTKSSPVLCSWCTLRPIPVFGLTSSGTRFRKEPSVVLHFTLFSQRASFAGQSCDGSSGGPVCRLRNCRKASEKEKGTIVSCLFETGRSKHSVLLRLVGQHSVPREDAARRKKGVWQHRQPGGSAGRSPAGGLRH